MHQQGSSSALGETASVEHHGYRRDQLEGIPPPLELPTDRPRSAARAADADTATRPFALGPAFSREAARSNRDAGVDPFAPLLGAFLALAHRYTGQDDLLIGIFDDADAGEGRSPALALRTDVSGDPSFAELLRRVREALQEAFARRDGAPEHIRSGLQPVQDQGDGSPLRVLCQYRQAPDGPGPSLPPGPAEGGRTLRARSCDLALLLDETEHRPRGRFVYDPSLFDAATIERMSDHLRDLLDGGTAEPERRISELPLLTGAERARLLVEWNATRVPYAREMLLHRLIEEQAQRTPDAVAAASEGQRLTYRELDECANQVAHHLRRLGVGPDILVGVCLERSLDLVIGLLGILKAGGAYVPLDPDYPAERLAFMLEDASVPVLLTHERLRGRLPRGGARVVCLDADRALLAQEQRDDPRAAATPANLAYVIYTSGSTGQPKGAMLTHAGICNRLLWMQEAYRLDADDRVLQKTPFSFDVSVWEFFWPLITGARLVLARPGGHRDGAYLVDAIAEHRITTLHFVPSMLQALLERPDLERCACLLRVICSGEALPFALQGRFFARLDAELHNLYGPTEASVDVTAWACERLDARRVVPIGRPIANTQVYLLDAHLRPVPIGVPGELHIGGVALARGYLRRPELTAERFVPDPFGAAPGARLYRTGDLARYRPDGCIEYLGRLDHQVKLRGYRIELGEIEATLGRHPGVQEAVVVARDDVPGDVRLVAYVVPDARRAGAVRRLLRAANDGRLAGRVPYELPNGMVVIPQNRAETDFMYDEIFVAQVYTRFGITLREGDCVFDVGANIGLFTLFASRQRKGLTIYAFEPIPPIFEALRLNAEIYGVDAKLFDCGLADAARIETFTHYPHCSILSGRFADTREDREVVKTFLRNQHRGEGAPGVTPCELDELVAARLTSESFSCRLRTLSDVMREHAVGRIDLLKIDAEKSEQEVLVGICEDDWPKIGQIVVEVHDIGGRLDRIVALLRGHGYQVALHEDASLETTGLYNVYAIRPSATSEPPRMAHPGRNDASGSGWCSPDRLISDVQRFLGERLPDHMVPAAFVPLDALPLTPSGKVDRRALPAPGRDRSALDASIIVPRTATEAALAALWAEALGVERVGVHDNFFALGGHSLLATRVASRVRAAFQVEVPLLAFFESPTIAELAPLLDGEIAARGPADGKGETVESAPPLRPIRRSGPLPLSFSQERIWFVQHLDPGNRAYNFQATLRLKGELDVATLERSLGEIVRRHEIFRTTFPSIDGAPVQTIHPPRPIALPVIDLSGAPERRRAAVAQRRVDEFFGHTFDLTRLPLIRWLLLRLSAREHILAHVEHHIIHDGWSFNVFLRELTLLYTAYARGEPSPLPVLPVQFADFASWQREWMRGAALEAQAAYWKERLRGAPAILELPADRPRPVRQTFRGAAPRFELPPDLCDALRAIGRRTGTTLFMVLLTGFFSLLHRYTGQDDICVGSGIANRRWRETEAMIGMLINNVVLRADLSGDPTIPELLARVRGVTLGAYAHQDIPFDKVVEAVRPPRDPSWNPLFQVMFSFHDSPLPELKLLGIAIEPTEGLSNGSAKFDMNIIAIPRSEQRVGRRSRSTSSPPDAAPDTRGIALIWEYNTDLFDRATIERMVGRYQTLLEGIAADPARRLSRLPLLASAERERLLVEWNATAAPVPLDRCFTRLFEEQVGRTPEAPAMACGQERLTYRELNARANRVAHQLMRGGVGPGDLIALLAPRGIALWTLALAVLKAGGAYLPLDPLDPPARMGRVLARSRCKLVIASEQSLPGLRPTLDGLEGAERPDALSLEGLLARRDGPAENPPPRATPQDLAYVIYTSGSTGVPKGAMIEHVGMVNHLYAKIIELALGPADVVAQNASQCFDISVWQALAPLLVGGQVRVFAEEGTLPVALLDQVEAAGVSVLEIVPSQLGMLLDEVTHARPGARPPLAALRWLVLTGEALPPELARQWLNHYPHVPIVNACGATECSDDVTHHVARRPPDAAVLTMPIGRPVANMRAYVLDGWLQPVPVGVIGELCYGGIGVGRGYLHEPARTAETFVPDPYGAEPGARLYRTGDLARYLPDGNLVFLGRRDHQVKVRGFRVELGEVEAALGQHPGVREVAVMADADASGEKRLVAHVAYQRPDRGREPPSTAELRAFLKERLPDYMVPATFVALERLPLTPNGKVDRRALPAARPARSEGSGQRAAPRTATEAALATIWAEALGVERVGVHDDFFALGGHSLLAIQVVARARAALGRDVPLRALFEAPTIAGLADALPPRADGPSEATARPIPRARRAGGRAPDRASTTVDRLTDAEVHTWLQELVTDKDGQA